MTRSLVFLLALVACSQESVPNAVTGTQPVVEAAEAAKGDRRCWYGGCEGPFYSAAPARFGRYEIGDRVLAVPDDAVTSGGDCSSANDCSFTLSDGVEYLLFEQWVTRKRILLPSTHALPFGLRGDETQEELVRRMSDLLGVEARVVAVRQGRTLISHEGTLGTLENPQWLYFELDESGRLREISWHGPQTT